MKSFFITLGQLVFALLMYAMGTIFFGIALVPALVLVHKVWQSVHVFEPLVRYFLIGASLSAGFIVFGLSLILVIGLTRMLLFIRLKEGNYSIFSWPAVKWAFVSTLYLLINFTFMDFVLLTPFANLLLRLLGAKLGKNVQINSKFVFDATLLEIGDNTVIGGSAIIIGHIVERGILKLRKVKIGSNVTIGSHSTVMPGCEIGDHAILGAGAVLLKNTKIQPREIWFGVPAECVRRRPHLTQATEAGNAQGQS